MAVSVVQRSKRALLSLLKKLANKHSLELALTRDPADAEVRKSYRKLSRSAHPDRGGRAEEQSKLNVAYGIWEKIRLKVSGVGCGSAFGSLTCWTCRRAGHRLAKQHTPPGSNQCSAPRRHRMSPRRSPMPFGMYAARLSTRRVLHQGHNI